MKKHRIIKTILALTLSGSMALSPTLHAAAAEDLLIDETITVDSYEAKTNATEFTPEEVQGSLELVGKGLEALENPWAMAGFVVGDILPIALGVKQEDPSKHIMEQLDEILKNQEKMKQQLSNIDTEIMTVQFMEILRENLYLDSAGVVMTHYTSIHNLDEDNKGKQLTDEEKAAVMKDLENILKYSIPKETEGATPSDSICDFDKLAYDIGTHIMEVPVSYGGKSTTDNIFGMYEMNCKYNYHWEHQAYDDLMTFRNSVYSNYVIASNLDAMSLKARIDAREAAGEAHHTLDARLAQLKAQIIDVRDLYNKTAVVKHSDAVRVYWYKNCDKVMLYTRAKNQEIPVDNTKYGTSRYSDYWKLDGVISTGSVQKGNFSFRPRLEHWRTFISYNIDDAYGGGTCLCPTVEWFKKIQEDYGSDSSLWDIFFSPTEGGMTPPDGSNNKSWRFMVDPASPSHIMRFTDGGVWPDSLSTPMLKFDASEDNSSQSKHGVDFYWYHNWSNEISKDYKKQIGGVIGIGVTDHDPGLNNDHPKNLAAKDDFDAYYKKFYTGNGFASDPEDEKYEYRSGSSEGLSFSFDAKTADVHPASHLKDIIIDDGSVKNPEAGTDYTAESTDELMTIRLEPAYLDTLGAGEHKLTAVFSEGIDAYAKYDDPVVNTAFAIIRDAHTIYEKDGSDHRACNPRSMKTGDSFTAVVLNSSGEEETVNEWKSSNDSVVTVTAEGLVTAVSAGDASIIASVSGRSVLCNVNVEAGPGLSINKVTLNKKKAYLSEGASATLTAMTDPAGADGIILKWSASPVNEDDIVLEVSEDEKSVKVTGNKAGSYIITVCSPSDPSVKAECTLVVTPGSDFTIAGKGSTDGSNVVKTGKKLPMTVTWNGRKPNGAKINWTVRNLVGEATINSKGVLTAIKEGTVKVEAYNEANPSKTASAYVDIYVPIKSIKLNAGSKTVSLSENAVPLKLSVDIRSATPDAPTGINYNEAPRVLYEVDEKYADHLDIDDNGVITPAAGTGVMKNIPVRATVLAFNGFEKTLTCKISIVNSNPLKNMKLKKSSVTMLEGDTYDNAPVFNPVNPDGGTGVTWEVTSGTDVVSVDANGRITAIKPGKATITATSTATVMKKGKAVPVTAKCKVVVKKAGK